MSQLLSPSHVLLGKSGTQQLNHCALQSCSKRLGASESAKMEQAQSREGALRTRRATMSETRLTGASRPSSTRRSSEERTVRCDGGYRELGHPRVYINLELDIAHIEV
uniref:Zf-CHCC domain-containing protein n=1 Tax=Globodera pallida TaxID=36090 RepID=A0A183BV49_GLOPA